MPQSRPQDEPAVQARLRDFVGSFEDAYRDNPDINHETILHQFVGLLLDILGWPKDTNQYKLARKQPEEGGIPDVILAPSGRPLCAVEVKRPKEPAAHTIPDIRQGSSYDARQLGAGLREKLRYVMYKDAEARWLILVSMTHLHVFDSRTKRWILTFNSPRELVSRHEELSLLSLKAVVQGASLDRLARKYTSRPVETLIESLNQWRISLAQSVWTQNQKFPDMSLDLAQAAVRRMLDRLIIIQIIDDKGLIVGKPGLLDEQLDQWQREKENPIGGVRSLSDRLKNMFLEFNTRYNSTIFEPDVTDDLVYDDEALAEVAAGIAGTGFAGLDSRVIGTAYERYAGYRLELEEESLRCRIDPRFRQSTGTYYTPDYIVRYVVEHTLRPALLGKTLPEIQDFRVVDKACGSGSFLLGAFDVLAAFYEKEKARLQMELIAATDAQERTRLAGLLDLAANYPRRILERHLYGVDLNPEAAEFATVSLIVHALEYEKGRGGSPESLHLPLILNQNIKVGNSLISGLDTLGSREREAWLEEHKKNIEKVRRLREALHETADPDQKQRMIEEIRRLTDDMNWGEKGLCEGLSRSFGSATEARAQRPFNWEIEFPEVFDLRLTPEKRGFDCDIGNPPYVNIRRMRGYDSLQVDYLTASPVFASRGVYDVYVLFLERTLRVCRGKAGFIVSRKFFYQDYGEAARRLLGEANRLRELVDFTHLQVFEESDATTYTCLLLMDRSQTGQDVRLCRLTALDKDGRQLREMPESGAFSAPGVRVDCIPASCLMVEPWVPVFDDERAVMRRMEEHSVPLGKGGVDAHIFVGIQTSADDIYILDYLGQEGDCYVVRAKASELKRGDRVLWSRSEQTLKMEKALLKPLLSGEDVRSYSSPEVRQVLLFPYEVAPAGEAGAERATLMPWKELSLRYPLVTRYLDDSRVVLEEREHGKMRHDGWYGYVYPKNMTIQEGRKLASPSLVDRVRCLLDTSGVWFLDNVDVCGVRLPHCRISYEAMFCLLNSTPFSWYARAIAPPFRGGFFRVNKQFLSRTRVPRGLFADDSLPVSDTTSLAANLQKVTGERRMLCTDFRRFVEHLSLGRTIADILKTIPTRDKSQVRGINVPKDHLVRRAGARREGDWVVLNATFRDPTEGGDYNADIYRFRLSEPAAGLVERFLPTLGPSEFPKGKTLTAYQKVAAARIPSGSDEDIRNSVEAYDREKARADKLDADIAASEAEVDDICFRLYGLRESDIEVMKQSSM